MSPEEKGRFCQHCQKTVVDFSNMTDRELVNYFSTASGRVCGRFMPEQLNRETVIPRESKQPFISIAAMLSALYFFIPGTKAAIRPMTTQGQADTTEPATEPVPLNRVITGTVTSDGQVNFLEGVTVRIKDTYIGTMTNENGHFRIVLPESYTDTSALLKFSYVGYSTEEMRISLSQQSESLCVVLKEPSDVLGIVVTTYRPMSRWKKITRNIKSRFR